MIQLIIKSSKSIAKSYTEVATSALLYKIASEMKQRGSSFEVNQSAIDASAIFWFSIKTIINAQSKSELISNFLLM